jgi:hypothetical protein
MRHTHQVEMSLNQNLTGYSAHPPHAQNYLQNYHVFAMSRAYLKQPEVYEGTINNVLFDQVGHAGWRHQTACPPLAFEQTGLCPYPCNVGAMAVHAATGSSMCHIPPKHIFI